MIYTEELRNKDKKIELWLTEWNSVDFNPGPQTLSVEQGLFVALTFQDKLFFELKVCWRWVHVAEFTNRT